MTTFRCFQRLQMKMTNMWIRSTAGRSFPRFCTSFSFDGSAWHDHVGLLSTGTRYLTLPGGCDEEPKPKMTPGGKVLFLWNCWVDQLDPSLPPIRLELEAIAPGYRGHRTFQLLFKVEGRQWARRRIPVIFLDSDYSKYITIGSELLFANGGCCFDAKGKNFRRELPLLERWSPLRLLSR